MARGDRICFVDMIHYNYCPACGGDPDETWRFLYCSENCLKLEKLWEKYFRDHLISDEEAIKQFKELDTSHIGDFRDQIREDMIKLKTLAEHYDRSSEIQTTVSEKPDKIIENRLVKIDARKGRQKK